MRSKSPRSLFGQNRRNAIWRGIGWNLTFDQWQAVWEASGKWPLRGRGRGRYVLCRKGDVGPYSPENVFIGLHEENVSNTFRKRSGLPIGVTRHVCKTGLVLYEARRTVDGRDRYLGCYPTPELAHQAYLSAPPHTPAPRQRAANGTFLRTVAADTKSAESAPMREAA